MPELIKIQCTCGSVFQTLPQLGGPQDAEGNQLCENCAVEQGLLEDLTTEPPEVVVVVVTEGADAEETEWMQSTREEAIELVDALAPKLAELKRTAAGAIDMRTNEAKAAKAAGLI